MASKTPVLYCDDGSEIELPSKWVICTTCRGEGKSSAYLGAYTQEDMDAAGPEFKENYINGLYDRPCFRCDGAGKRLVADVAKMPREQCFAYLRQQQEEREGFAIEASERRSGC